MWRTITCWLLIAAIGARAGAEDKKVNGPSQVPIGKLVRLDVSEISGDLRSWILVNPPTDGDQGKQNTPEVANEGKTAFFSTIVPGTYYFSVCVSGLKPEAGDKPQVQQIHLLHVLVVGDGPLPDVVIPLPEGKFGLAVLCRDEAKNTGVKRLTASAMGRVYRSVAGKIKDGNLKTPEEAIKQVNKELMESGFGTENHNPLYDSIAKLGAAIVKKMDELSKADKLKSMDDYSVAFSEIALGLESVK